MSKQVYLLIDATLNLEKVQSKLEKVLPLLSKIQLYHTQRIYPEYLKEWLDWLNSFDIPCFVYQNTSVLEFNEKVGIHLDNVEDLSDTEIRLERKIRKGVTVGNDIEKIKRAEQLGYDYISFCSVFPSESAEVCELVNREIIQQARKYFSGEIFLAGGINTDTKKQLQGLDYDGVAVISAIMSHNAEDIVSTVKKLQ